MKSNKEQQWGKNILAREKFHKQIRRQKLQKEFFKIRIGLAEQNQFQRKMTQKANQTIQMINNIDYHFLYEKFNLNCLNNYSIEGIRANFDLYQNPKFVEQINQEWIQIAQWEYNNKEYFNLILSTLFKSICPDLYNETVVNFLLGLLTSIIYAEKVKIMKQKISASKKVYLVGIQQSIFMEDVFQKCFNSLINLTGYEYDQLVLPFLQKMSNVCKKHPKSTNLYLNMFLNKNLTMEIKSNLFQDYLQMISQNLIYFTQNFGNNLDIILVYYSKLPLILENSKAKLLSFKLISLLNQLFKNFDLKTQSMIIIIKYTQEQNNNFKKAFQILNRIATFYPLELFQAKNILNFLTRNLRIYYNNSEQLKKLKLILEILIKILSQQERMIQIMETIPGFEFLLFKIINSLSDIHQKKQKEHQQYEQYEQYEYIQKQDSENIKQILFKTLYLLEIMASDKQNLQKFINQQKLLKNLIKIYFRYANQGNIKNRKIQGQCSTIFCLCILNQQKYDREFQNFIEIHLDEQSIQMLIQQIKQNKISKELALNTWIKLFNIIINEKNQKIQYLITTAIKQKNFIQILTHARDIQNNREVFQKICIILDYCQKQANKLYRETKY